MNFAASANACQTVALADAVCVQRSDTDSTLVRVSQRELLLKGPVFNALLPLLDGTRAAHQLVASLSTRFEALAVWLAIELLKKHCLLRTAGQTLAGPLPDLKMQQIDVPAPYHFYCAKMVPPDPGVPPIHVGGFGETALEAMAKCRGEAVERWFGFLNKKTDRVTARKVDLEGRVFDPSELLNFSDRQFAMRESLNRSTGGLDVVPHPFDPDVAIDWSPAHNMGSGEKCWLPTALVYYSSQPVSGSEFGVADSNGCAAGPSFERACLSGLLELIERDACAIWWYNQIIPPTIDARAFGDDALDRLMDFVATGQRNVRLLDLTHDFEIPVVAAVSWNGSTFHRPKLGLGIAFDRKSAAVKAVGELVTQIVTTPEQSGDNSAKSAQPVPAHVLGRSPDWTEGGPSTIALTVPNLLKLLREKELTAVVVDQADNAGPVGSVRVVVPGLRSLAARFGPGRLFKASPSHTVDERAMITFGTISSTFM
ncbi:YcaO-like family protein [Roseovarius aestuarii]|nr:YcaO-like family protein [Roseovarius aestuarii]